MCELVEGIVTVPRNPAETLDSRDMRISTGVGCQRDTSKAIERGVRISIAVNSRHRFEPRFRARVLQLPGFMRGSGKDPIFLLQATPLWRLVINLHLRPGSRLTTAELLGQGSGTSKSARHRHARWSPMHHRLWDGLSKRHFARDAHARGQADI